MRLVLIWVANEGEVSCHGVPMAYLSKCNSCPYCHNWNIFFYYVLECTNPIKNYMPCNILLYSYMDSNRCRAFILT